MPLGQIPLPTVTWTVRLVSLFTTTADVARPAANITWVAPWAKCVPAPLIVAKSPPHEVPDVRQYRPFSEWLAIQIAAIRVGKRCATDRELSHASHPHWRLVRIRAGHVWLCPMEPLAKGRDWQAADPVGTWAAYTLFFPQRHRRIDARRSPNWCITPRQRAAGPGVDSILADGEEASRVTAMVRDAFRSRPHHSSRSATIGSTAAALRVGT